MKYCYLYHDSSECYVLFLWCISRYSLHFWFLAVYYDVMSSSAFEELMINNKQTNK